MEKTLRTISRLMIGSVAAATAFLVSAGPASAHECTNADKNQAAGVQVVIDGNTGEIVWISNGLQRRMDQGLVTPDGVGFHGLIGFDLNGDGATDVSTYIVGPNDELPDQAQENGAPCHGVINIGAFFDCTT